MHRFFFFFFARKLSQPSQELLEEIDKKTRKPLKKKPTFVKSGAIVNVKLSFSAPVCVDLFDSYPQLGRFTLRDKGKSIAVGKVIKIGA